MIYLLDRKEFVPHLFHVHIVNDHTGRVRNRLILADKIAHTEIWLHEVFDKKTGDLVMFGNEHYRDDGRLASVQHPWGCETIEHLGDTIIDESRWTVLDQRPCISGMDRPHHARYIYTGEYDENGLVISAKAQSLYYLESGQGRPRVITQKISVERGKNRLRFICQKVNRPGALPWDWMEMRRENGQKILEMHRPDGGAAELK